MSAHGAHNPNAQPQTAASPRSILASRNLQKRDDGFHSSEPEPPTNWKRRILVWLAIVIAIVIALRVIDLFV